VSKNALSDTNDLLELKIFKEPLIKYRENLSNEKKSIIPKVKEILETIDWDNKEQIDRLQMECANSLHFEKLKLMQEKNALVSSTSREEQRYQKYKEDLKQWQEKKDALKGDTSVYPRKFDSVSFI
jgi:hypothetical protein